MSEQAFPDATKTAALLLEKAVIEFHAGVRSVAERFVLGRATTAKRYSVPLFVAFTVMRLDGDPAAHPERAAASQRRIFHHANRGGQRLFDLLARFLILQNQAARRAMHRLANHQFTNFGLIGPFDERPNLSPRIAEAGKGAQIFSITQDQRGPINGLCLPGVGHAARALAAIEPHLAMRTVTEWFALGMATTTKRVARFLLKCLTFLPVPGRSFVVGSDDLNRDWYISRNHVWSILDHDDFSLLRRLSHVRASLLGPF